MKQILLILFFVSAFCSLAFAGDQRVKGHWKDTDHDGVKDTYVQPYHKTEPNTSRYDNYSTQGNTNPWTGKEGTVNPNRDDNFSGSKYDQQPKQKRY